MKSFIVAIIVLLGTAFVARTFFLPTQKARAQAYLEANGYSDVSITGLRYWTMDLCGKSLRFKFEAKLGSEVKEGHVCHVGNQYQLYHNK